MKIYTQYLNVPNLTNCARCGRNHKTLRFKPLTNPVGVLTHWAECPINGQPILMRITGEPSFGVKIDDSQ